MATNKTGTRFDMYHLDGRRRPRLCETMTDDSKRNGTTALFAALNVLEAGLVGQCSPQHRRQEFIKLLNTSE